MKQIIKEIKKHKKIIILRHVLPDGDAYGFQFGLKKIIELNWPDKIVKISGLPNPKLDYIGKKFDKISDKEFADSLVIIGDTANAARIDDQRWSLGKKIIKIDHHPNRESYGDIVYVEDDYCATCELLTEIVIENKLKINSEIAKILYHGIVTDSERFLLRFPKPRTFILASFLLKQGFDLQDLYQTMYKKTEKDLKLISYVYQNYKKTSNGVAYLFFTKEILKDLGYHADQIAYDSVSLLANIDQVPIWAFFCEYDDKEEIRVELRSNKIKINHIAEKYGGGGHATSSGAKIKNFSIAKKILKDLNDLI